MVQANFGIGEGNATIFILLLVCLMLSFDSGLRVLPMVYDPGNYKKPA
jgi:hypothetical protein